MILPNLDMLLKCIILLYRENELGESPIDNSKELVKTILSLYKDNSNKSLMGGEFTLIDEIKAFILKLLTNPELLEKTTLLESVNHILREKSSSYAVVEKSISNELSIAGIKKSLISLRHSLKLFHKEQQIIALINKAAYKVNRGLETESLDEFVNQLAVNLEALNSSTKTKDPGIVDVLDISNEEDMSKVFSRVKRNSEDGGLLKTGWKELNHMLQGLKEAA